jgi:hypothetical protein
MGLLISKVPKSFLPAAQGLDRLVQPNRQESSPFYDDLTGWAEGFREPKKLQNPNGS